MPPAKTRKQILLSGDFPAFSRSFQPDAGSHATGRTGSCGGPNGPGLGESNHTFVSGREPESQIIDVECFNPITTIAKHLLVSQDELA